MKKEKDEFVLEELLKKIKKEDVDEIKKEMYDFINSPPVGKELL